KEERAWFAPFIIECIVIFLLNAFTLAIYTRNRHLRKPSTYLIINLTVADLLVGTVGTVLVRLSFFRLHATLFPFRHCLIGKRVYLTTICCSWLFSLTLSCVFSLLDLRASPPFPYVFSSYIFLSLLILTVSYVIIISTVKNNPPSPNAGLALSKERKLTVTLFTVNVVSVLTILPFVIWIVIAHHIQSKLCHAVFIRIEFSFDLLYLFNSIINPLIYAIRMQEFRKAATKLF
ncbi:unnamed protein product, partial [Porites lobata]